MAAGNETYEIEAAGYPIEVTRKDIKHLHIFVNAPFGSLTASAPLAMKDSEIIAFAEAHKPWIDKQVRELDDRAWTSRRQFVSGETIWIFGRQCFLKVRDGQKMSFSYGGDEAVLVAPEEATVSEREQFVYSVLRSELKKRINAAIDDIAEETGVDKPRIVVERRTTRWSSCNRKRNSVFVNALLVHQSSAALRLVLVYECLHLKYNPSTKMFKEKLEELVPDWKTILERMNSVPIPRK